MDRTQALVYGDPLAGVTIGLRRVYPTVINILYTVSDQLFARISMLDRFAATNVAW